jgi:hypothetical protein
MKCTSSCTSLIEIRKVCPTRAAVLCAVGQLCSVLLLSRRSSVYAGALILLWALHTLMYFLTFMHVLTGQLLASLVKLLLFRFSSEIHWEDVYSASKESKLSCFQRIYHRSDASLCLLKSETWNTSPNPR